MWCAPVVLGGHEEARGTLMGAADGLVHVNGCKGYLLGDVVCARCSGWPPGGSRQADGGDDGLVHANACRGIVGCFCLSRWFRSPIGGARAWLRDALIAVLSPYIRRECHWSN